MRFFDLLPRIGRNFWLVRTDTMFAVVGRFHLDRWSTDMYGNRIIPRLLAIGYCSLSRRRVSNIAPYFAPMRLVCGCMTVTAVKFYPEVHQHRQQQQKKKKNKHIFTNWTKKFVLKASVSFEYYVLWIRFVHILCINAFLL